MENVLNSPNECPFSSQLSSSKDCPIAENEGRKINQSETGVKHMQRSDFSFLKELGEGSYSTVYLAREKSTNREFACKVCFKKQIIKERKIQQIYREKEAMARLSEKGNRHPFIIQIYCTFQDADSLYMVITLAKGGDLFTKLKRNGGSFSEDISRFYTSEVVCALGHIHKLNIIHRDLKPENILLSDKGHILVSDFGSSKLLDKMKDRTESVKNTDGKVGRKRLTSFVGTAQYVSPEVLEGRDIQQSCDYWSLGVILFQMLTGKFAFNEVSEYLTYQNICKGRYEIPEFVSSEARCLIRRFLVVDASLRLGSVESGGVEAVMRHEFFDTIDWDNIENTIPPNFD
ncbi:hypothetical protein AB6A40_006670 [Gnathostoma spinigerum]|uniref:non-specific serine/threonine protein kinase n=1 Tax=Gnathostoma spinigerum TaxID=75299 RepID=A0ABD6ER89_9BILA